MRIINQKIKFKKKKTPNAEIEVKKKHTCAA